MTITAREIVNSIKESNIYINTSGDIDNTINSVIHTYAYNLSNSLSLVKSLPSENTETIHHLREIQYLLTYEKESVETALHEYISLIKLHEII